MKVYLEYNIENESVAFCFNQDGDFISLHVNGRDESENGQMIEAMLERARDYGHNIQRDISREADRQRQIFENEGYGVPV